MSSRVRTGSVVRDKRDKVWRFFWWEDGKRRSKALGRFTTKAAAWSAAKPLRDALEVKPQNTPGVPTVSTLVEQYRAEKMPKRKDTRGGYESWLRVYILPRWADHPITELQARPVELWLDCLSLTPKSKVHIRGILSSLWNFAMWKQDDVPMQVNPITLVTVRGASKRTRQPRTLTVEQFRLLVSHLPKPFNTLALMCVCFGLRISEALALKWADVDWLKGTLRVERGIVQQIVDDVKTDDSRKTLTISDDLHTYRTWLDSVGTPVGVQQRLMRHSDIRTTMNIYGDAVTPDMREAHGKIVGLALNGTETARKRV